MPKTWGYAVQNMLNAGGVLCGSSSTHSSSEGIVLPIFSGKSVVIPTQTGGYSTLFTHSVLQVFHQLRQSVIHLSTPPTITNEKKGLRN